MNFGCSVTKDGGIPTTIDASSAQGLQVGSGNVQHNVWTTDTPLDPASLSALSPQKAAGRIRSVSHNAAVDFFARAPVGDTQEILRELLRTDENKVVSILADLNRRRAEKLINPLAHDFSWLADLPKAAEDIASHAVTLDLGDDQGPVQVGRTPTTSGSTHFFVRTYKQAVIYWNVGSVCVLNEQIARYYAEAGGVNGVLGPPLEEIADSAESQYGTKGVTQGFKEGIVCSSGLGTYEICGQFSKAYHFMNGFKGWLGFPTSTREPYDENVTIQRFEGGTMYSSRRGTFPVRKAVDECARGLIPVASELDAGRSPISREYGQVQYFRVGSGAKIAIYSSGSGIYRVGWKILKYYRAMGGPTSRLGFPISGTSTIDGQGYTQMFQGGCVYVESASGVAVTVPPTTVDRLRCDAEIAAKLGWPTSEEKPVENGEVHIQFFDNGVVTRKKSSEVWLRP